MPDSFLFACLIVVIVSLFFPLEQIKADTKSLIK